MKYILAILLATNIVTFSLMTYEQHKRNELFAKIVLKHGQIQALATKGNAEFKRANQKIDELIRLRKGNF